MDGQNPAPPFRNPGMIRFPGKYQQAMVSTMVSKRCERISSIHSRIVAEAQILFMAPFTAIFSRALVRDFGTRVTSQRLGGFSEGRGTFPILNPGIRTFQETIKKPGETAGF